MGRLSHAQEIVGPDARGIHVALVESKVVRVDQNAALDDLLDVGRPAPIGREPVAEKMDDAARAVGNLPSGGRERLGLDGAFGTVDRALLNVHGSSLAAGHPFAATGGRIVATIAKELHLREQRDGGTPRALVSICAAGGLGLTAILEAA